MHMIYFKGYMHVVATIKCNLFLCYTVLIQEQYHIQAIFFVLSTLSQSLSREKERKKVDLLLGSRQRSGQRQNSESVGTNVNLTTLSRHVTMV